MPRLKRQLSFALFPPKGSSGPGLVLGLPLPRLAKSPDHCGFRGQGLKRRGPRRLCLLPDIPVPVEHMARLQQELMRKNMRDQ